MRPTFFFVLLIVAITMYGQHFPIKRSIYQRDISDSSKNLFKAQLDSFKKYQSGIIPMDERNTYLIDSSLITYCDHYSKGFYGVKYWFSRVGGIGCGYHEGDEPYKITIVKNGKELNIPFIYDFEDSTKWLSSFNFNQEKLNLHFRKGFWPLTKLIFFAGDQSNMENWNRYSRPKTISIYLNKKYWTDLHFDDCTCEQIFEFEPIKGNRSLVMTLVIKEVYPGIDKRVAISEINFDGLSH